MYTGGQRVAPAPHCGAPGAAAWQRVAHCGPQRHINGVVSKHKRYDNFGFGGIRRPF